MEARFKPAGVVAIVGLGAVALLALLLSKELGVALPPSLRSLLWLLIPLVGAAAVTRQGALTELGLTRFEARGVLIAVGGSLVMLVGLALGGGAPSFDPGALWRSALRPGFVEEVAFRGFLFGLLYWRARWSFVAALLTSGVIFGSFHLPGAWLGGHLDQAWGAFAVTAVGGVWFAWLYARWNRSLWVPIAAHASMNFWWVLYSAGPTAAGGGAGATWGRVGAIAAITIATSRWTGAVPKQA